MNLDEFKVLSKYQLKSYGETIPLGSLYDKNNNKLTYKDSNGYWNEYTYNDNNNVLSYTSSNGYWKEFTYDENNNKLTFKNSNGIVSICLCNGIEYILWYDINTKNYIAGCQTLSYNQCIKFFNKTKQYHADAELFMKAIEEHHKSLAYHLKICIIDTSKQIKENIMNIINYILVGGLAAVIFGGGTFFGCLIAGFCVGALYNIIEEQMKKVAKEKEENGLTKPKE